MNVLQGVTALFRSSEAAVMAAQAVQYADLAARQGAASLQRDVAERNDQVLEPEALVPSDPSGARQNGEDAPGSGRRRRGAGDKGPDLDPAPIKRSRLDILA
jgi:hypothetical protein